MAEVKEAISKLLEYSRQGQEKDVIDSFEETIAKSFVEAVEEESFYKLPRETIKGIFAKFIKEESPNANSISKVIKSISIRDPESGFNVLKLVKLDAVTFEECVAIISSATGCPICKRLGEMFAESNSLAERDYVFELKKKDEEIKELRTKNEAELKKKDQEIEDLRSKNVVDVVVRLFVGNFLGEEMYLFVPKEITLKEFKDMIKKRCEIERDFIIRNNKTVLSDSALISGDWRRNGIILDILPPPGKDNAVCYGRRLRNGEYCHCIDTMRDETHFY